MENTVADTARELISVVVRIIGLFLLFAGLWVAIQVLKESLDLYHNPANIERMAIAIEQGSNIDKSLAPLKESLETEGDTDPLSPAQINVEKAPAKVTVKNEFRLSYFIAWVIAILLLLLIARISLAAIKTGGELALYDVHIRRFARALINESARQNK
ncbi:MAG: hypothetical protein A2W28_05225 [Gammaproteobacteria bacterium RBG_16_51_14]|nr:MAG: hypothetical protein A2W28_05225 [Gammaproteobacteria bacterium RBG_16_51_14]